MDQINSHLHKMENNSHLHIIPTISAEQSFDFPTTNAYFKAYWIYTIPISLLYFLAVRAGKAYMTEKSPWKLQIPLVLWSGLLALFSWVGTIRISVLLLLYVREYGYLHTTCQITEKLDNATWLWLHLFVLSKLPELGDTFFIVARKGKLPFLHWYHHMTVFIYSFYICAYPHSGMLWYAGMNYAVHALMYTYYTLKALKIPVPRPCAVFITGCQLLQMLMGVTLTVSSYVLINTGYSCDTTTTDLYFSMIIYGSYMILFANFFYQTYLKPKPKAS